MPNPTTLQHRKLYALLQLVPRHIRRSKSCWLECFSPNDEPLASYKELDANSYLNFTGELLTVLFRENERNKIRLKAHRLGITKGANLMKKANQNRLDEYLQTHGWGRYLSIVVQEADLKVLNEKFSCLLRYCKENGHQPENVIDSPNEVLQILQAQDNNRRFFSEIHIKQRDN